MKKTKKQIFTISLILSLCLCFCSCNSKNKKAFEMSKSAYDDIHAAYEITEEIGTGLYEAWRISIYEKDEVSAENLSKHSHLSTEEVNEGIVYTIFSLANDADYETASKEDKEIFRNKDKEFFYMFKDQLSSACLKVISNAYRANGKVTEAEELLESAKIKMRELSEKYSDYEHYPNLKGLYTTTQSFLEFCENPYGSSFEQYSTTYNDYVNKARDYNNDLKFIFE